MEPLTLEQLENSEEKKMSEEISYEIQRMLDDEEEDRLTREGQERYEKEMQKILNLTQHNATPEQIEAGVFEPSEEDKKTIQKLLTFDEIPTVDEMNGRANALYEIFDKIIPECRFGYTPHSKTCGTLTRCAMIGGAPYLMGAIECVFKIHNVKCMYAFSKRESVDQTQPDGSVRKVAVFKHCGFVEV